MANLVGEGIAVSEEINRSASSSQPGYGFEELRYLKRTVTFNELDKRYLRMASEVLRDRADALLSEWYQYLCSQAHLRSYFQPEGQSQTSVREAVRQRFGQWLVDTCMGDYDLEWFDRQQQIGLGYLPPCDRHPMPLQYAIASIAPFTNILKQFLASIGYNSEAVDRMHQALFKSILLQVAFSQITKTL